MLEPATYGEAIRLGFEYLLEHDEKVFAIGQGLWSPWYVGNSMTDLDKKFGRHRIIDTPVSELGTTGAAVGAALCGFRPIVIHPRMDFMLLAVDQIVNQAAKWFHMLGGQEPCPVTIRAIINRGGEQGAQHSQALHSWFAHIPGLRVVMPATVQDARDLLIASVRCDDPVLYVDDRWLYELRADLPPVTPIPLESVRPELLRSGKDVTVVGAGYSTQLGIEAAELLAERGIGASVIDLRVINPLDCDLICDSVRSTRRLCAIDGGWRTCGLAGEIVARVSEKLPPGLLAAPPLRMTLPDAPAPTSKPLETAYYPTASRLAEAVESLFAGQRRNRS